MTHDLAALASVRSLAFFPGPSPASSVPEAEVGDRSQTFQPVEGGTDHRSGETLLVAAYAGLWTILMAWVLLQWVKQTALARRLESLEAAIAQASKGASRDDATPAPPRDGPGS